MLFPGRANPADFPSFISSLNRTLKPLGMEIAMGHMEDTGEVWYGLVNRVRDTAAKICSGYTPAELELFNRVVSSLGFQFQYEQFLPNGANPVLGE